MKKKDKTSLDIVIDSCQCLCYQAVVIFQLAGILPLPWILLISVMELRKMWSSMLKFQDSILWI